MKILITGATKGIGLELTREAVKRGFDVIAVARTAVQSAALKDLGAQVQRVDADMMDPEAPDKILAAAEKAGHIDILFNNAGILEQGTGLKDFLKTFQINSVMPFLITEKLLPLLKKSKNPKVIHTTSRMGSIADNTSGGYSTYRSSKAALNMLNRSLTIDHPWLTTLVMHPGWVQTEMGGAQAPVLPQDSARGIWQVVDGLTPARSGQFMDYRGEPIPW